MKPTVGRKVWLWTASATNAQAADQPFDATVIFVHSPSVVDLQYTNHWGTGGTQKSVPLREPSMPGDGAPESVHGVNDVHGSGETYATWMPFQVGQAKAQAPERARTEAQG